MSQVSKASIIQPETILDFIDGVTQRRDTPRGASAPGNPKVPRA